MIDYLKTLIGGNRKKMSAAALSFVVVMNVPIENDYDLWRVGFLAGLAGLYLLSEMGADWGKEAAAMEAKNGAKSA